MVDKTRHKCHDCCVLEGELHTPGCDVEKCPQCGGQYISCDCPDSPFPRWPYWHEPLYCQRCGDEIVKMVMHPDVEWNRNVGDPKALLCEKCYQLLKAWRVDGSEVAG
jgi:hypothetical protein